MAVRIPLLLNNNPKNKKSNEDVKTFRHIVPQYGYFGRL